MINTEDKVRLVLQMLGVVMVWNAGMEWVAVVLFLALLPWTPIYPALKLIAAVGGWMAQPVADKVADLPIENRQAVSGGKLGEVLKVG
jgi:hypothetical protein